LVEVQRKLPNNLKDLKMLHRDMENLTLIDKIYFIIIALIAGIVHFFKRDLRNVKLWKKFFIFLYDTTVAGSISVFTGLIVFSIYDNLALALGVGGMFGHIGTRTLYLFELAFKQKFGIKEQTGKE
jgi:hypothetical protein